VLIRRWLLIGAVVGVAALIDLVLLRGKPWGSWPSADWVFVLMLSMASSHGSLLGLWAALGGKATPWRFAAAFVAVVACIWMLGDSDLAFWVFVLLVQMVAMSGLLLLGRLLGLELADDLCRGRAEASAAEGPWVQYSLRALLSWTAACAVLLGAAHYLPKWPGPGLFVFLPATAAAALFGSSVATGVGTLWMSLGARWPAARIVGLGLAVAAGVTILWLGIGNPREFWEYVTFCLFQAAYLVGLLWLIRLAGYGLVWRRRLRL
jgi:hypothetical protein